VETDGLIKTGHMDNLDWLAIIAIVVAAVAFSSRLLLSGWRYEKTNRDAYLVHAMH
jgi:hypothetical protein